MRSGSGLPSDVEAIAERLARRTRGPEDLKWIERAKFKADLVNSPSRWRRISARDFAAKLCFEGVTDEDVVELTAWLERAQAGRKFTPHISFRSYRYGSSPVVQANQPGRSSRQPLGSLPLRADVGLDLRLVSSGATKVSVSAAPSVADWSLR